MIAAQTKFVSQMVAARRRFAQQITTAFRAPPIKHSMSVQAGVEPEMSVEMLATNLLGSSRGTTRGRS